MLGLLLLVGCTARPGPPGKEASHDVVKYPVGASHSNPDYDIGCCEDVAGGGDFNADGYVDLATSSRGNFSMHTSGHAEITLGMSPGFEPDPATFLFDVEDYEADVIPIAVAGDVNADGYDDVIVSADEAQLIKIYAGSASGVSSYPTWTLPEFAGELRVASVAGAGDVNADGYDDVVVGVSQAAAPGGATVHLGSAAGILDDTTNQALASGSTTADAFGFKVAGAGDVNGDGYADVIVGGGASFTRVFYGSASGILATGGTALETESITYSVAGAGDVNGDGYDDVLVGMGNTEPTGSAALFFGGPGGVDPASAWTHEGVEGGYRYGEAVAGLGDINGDGYGDIITGSDQVPDIFLGSSTGLGADPAVSLGCCGMSVSTAGDVDHDGLPDVVVGGGRVYLASTIAEWVGEADTDSDSDSDSDADGDTDTDSDSPPIDSDSAHGDSAADSDPGRHPGGCQGDKQGCATLSGTPFGAGLGALSIAFLVARRRALSQG